MKQREVQDDCGVRWTCVQALSGGGDAAAEAAADRLERADGTVPVVCTPSGKAVSVRVALARGWEGIVSDAELLQAVAAAQRAAAN